MLVKLSNKQKILAFVIAGILITGCIFIGVNVVKFGINKLTPQPTPEPPVQITYCGAYPQGICILYFGQDDTGDTVIQLFVSPPTFPDFYMTVDKSSGQVLYECKKDEDEETNVQCRGEALLLGDQVEINILSIDGDIPFANGKFAVTALLVIKQNDNSEPPLTLTSAPASATEPVSTFEIGTATPVPVTVTPSVSYPNYP